MGGPISPDWIGENELITEKDPTFDEVTLLPSTMKSVSLVAVVDTPMTAVLVCES